jgi:hypothetical protein
VELPFRIKFSLSRKLCGYELPAISKWHNVGRHIMKKLQKTILILSIIFFTSCKKEVTELEFERNVITEIFPVIVDSICVDARKMIPPPKGSFSIINNRNILIDTSKATKEEKIEYIKWKSNNRKLENDTSTVILAFDPILKKSESKYLENELKNTFLVSEIFKPKQKENLTIDIAEIKLNKKFKLKNITEFPKANKALLYEVKYNFVFSGILEISRIEFDKKRKVGVLEANFSYCGKCGRGYLIFLKKENNKWKIYKLKDTWIS